MAARHSTNPLPRPTAPTPHRDLLAACVSVAQTALARATRHTSDAPTRQALQAAQARLRPLPQLRRSHA